MGANGNATKFTWQMHGRCAKCKQYRWLTSYVFMRPNGYISFDDYLCPDCLPDRKDGAKRLKEEQHMQEVMEKVKIDG